MGSGADRWRLQRCFWPLLLLTVAPFVAALWLVDLLPFLDVSANLGQAQDLARLLAGDPRASDLQLAVQPWPNFLGPLLTALGGRVLGVEQAGRLLLSIDLLATPAAMVLLLRRLRRPTWPALAVAPVLAGPLLGICLINFMTALPLLLLGLALALGRQPQWRLALVGLLTGLLLFSTHLMVFALFLLLGPTLVLLQRPGQLPRALTLAAGGGLALTMTVLPWAMRFESPELSLAAGQSLDSAWFAVTTPPYHVRPQFLESLLNYELLMPGYQWLVLLIGTLLFTSAIGAPRVSHRRRLLLAAPALLALVLAMTLPERIGTTGMVSYRTTSVLALFALALAPMVPGRTALAKARFIAFLLVVAAAGIGFVLHLERRQAAYREAELHLAAIPEGRRVLVLPRAPGQPCFQWSRERHLSGLVSVRRDALTNLEFPWIATSWLRYRADSPRRLHSEGLCDGKRLDHRALDAIELAAAGWYDLVLARNAEEPRRRGRFVPELAGRDFVLYRNREREVRFSPPAVDRFCRLMQHEGRVRAVCDHRLTYAGARRACQAWNGARLVSPAPGEWASAASAGANVPGQRRMAAWDGARFDPVRNQWLGGAADPGPRPAPDYGCLQAAGKHQLRQVACGCRALPVCRLPQGRPLPALPGWRRMDLPDSPLLVGPVSLPFGDAATTCAKLGGEPLVPRDALEARYVMQLAGEHQEYRGALWIAPPQPGSEAALELGRLLRGPVGLRPACGLADGTLALCNALRPFVCEQGSEASSGARERP